MGLADAVLALLWLALTAYVVLAGADFGGGVWDALARGPSAAQQRRAIARESPSRRPPRPMAWGRRSTSPARCGWGTTRLSRWSTPMGSSTT